MLVRGVRVRHSVVAAHVLLALATALAKWLAHWTRTQRLEDDDVCCPFC